MSAHAPLTSQHARAMRSAASGFACPRAASPISTSQAGVAEELRKNSAQRLGGKLRLGHEPRRTYIRQITGIACLMVVHRVRIGNQYRADSGRRKLGDGQGTGAAYHEVSPGVGLGHIGDEGDQLGFDTLPGIRGACHVQRKLAGLMADVRALPVR